MPAIEKMSNNSNQEHELLCFFRIIIHFLHKQRLLKYANGFIRYFVKNVFMQIFLGLNMNRF